MPGGDKPLLPLPWTIKNCLLQTRRSLERWGCIACVAAILCSVCPLSAHSHHGLSGFPCCAEAQCIKQAVCLPFIVCPDAICALWPYMKHLRLCPLSRALLQLRVIGAPNVPPPWFVHMASTPGGSPQQLISRACTVDGVCLCQDCTKTSINQPTWSALGRLLLLLLEGITQQALQTRPYCSVVPVQVLIGT